MSAGTHSRGKTALTIYLSVFIMVVVTLTGVMAPRPAEAQLFRGAMGGALLGGLIGGGRGAAIGALAGGVIGAAREQRYRDATAQRTYRAQGSIDMERRQLENERMNLARERRNLEDERRRR